MDKIKNGGAPAWSALVIGGMTLEKLLAIVAEWWLTWVFGIIAGVLIWKTRQIKKRQTEQENRQKALEEGVQALLRGEIIRAYEKYQERGNITVHGLEAVEKSYTAYHVLGGNGTVTKLMDDMREMEVECQ